MSKPLLDVKNISKSFGRQTVLDNVSFQVDAKRKIALIGRNGAGKTTLLKILLGEEESDCGDIHFFDWTRVGVIRQNEVLPTDRTTQIFLEQVSSKPSWEVKKMGAKFGLYESHLLQSPGELSGGYQMRVKLVAMFLQDPNLLFLDEPVNYLDLQTLILLETVLADYKGSFILVAHDRTFLQNTCDIVYEIERGKLTIYKGKVQEFLDWKQKQLQFALKTNKKLVQEVKHHQKFVDRFRYKASLATRAQNKIKHIAKLRSKIVKIDSDLLVTKITVTAPRVHGGTAVFVQDLAIGYEDYEVAKNINFEIMRGEKVLITGENGRGKSTLLKTLVEKIKPLNGRIKWWKHADIGYYDQMTSKSLNNRDTVLSHLTKYAPKNSSAEKILMMAGNFLFRNDDLDKKINVLSGGERARLALAGILLGEHNVLILDEPTNHMDVETSDALALALQEYSGTVIFVSHARTFVSTLADKILEVKNGTVKEYIGSYEDHIENIMMLMKEEFDINKLIGGEGDVFKEDKQKKRMYHERVRELQRLLKRLENEIQGLESDKSEILKFFFENPTDYAPKKAQRLTEVEDELIRLEQLWLDYNTEIEELRTKI